MEMRDRILDNATKLFVERGFDGTSLQAIASAVGIQKASLLYHFKSKEQLRLAVLRNLLQHWQEAIPRLLKAAAGKSRFEELTRELFAFFVDNPDRARLILREALDRPGDLENAFTEHVSPWVTLLSDQIRQGQQQGRSRPEVDPEAFVVVVILLAVSVVSNLDAMSALLGEKGTKGRRERLMAEVMRVLRAALFLPGVAEKQA